MGAPAVWGKRRVNGRLLHRPTKHFRSLNQAELVFAVIALVLHLVQLLSEVGAMDLKLLVRSSTGIASA